MNSLCDRRAAGFDYPGPINPVISYEPPVRLTHRVELGANVAIGAHSYVNGGMIFPGVRIGRFCSIAYGVSLGVAQHDTALATTHPFMADRLREAEGHASSEIPVTTIGHDTWIGQNAVIFRGVTVGIGAVIGANAVVNSDIPPYAVVGGLPARVLKYRFGENGAWIEGLLDSAWWLLPMAFLEQLPGRDVPRFIDLVTAYRGSHPEDSYTANVISEAFKSASE